jgi:tyrosine-protein kinase Etk/Wzc
MNEEFVEDLGSDSEKKSNINVKEIFGFLLSKWYVFLFSIIFAIYAGKLNIRYATPLYKIVSKVLIKTDKNSAADPTDEVMQNLGIGVGKANVDDEVEILKTENLMEQVVRAMHLNVRYTLKAKFKPTELYGSSLPFKFVVLDDENQQKQSFKYELHAVGSDGFMIVGAKRVWKGSWGQIVNLPAGRVMILRNFECPINLASTYVIQISDISSATERYLSVYEPAVPSKMVSTISLSLKDAIPERGKDILNKIMQIYIQNKVDDIDIISDSTIKFINDRVAILGRELNAKESEIETYKKKNGVVDLETQNEQLIQNNSDIDKELENMQVDFAILGNVEKYIQEHPDAIVPSQLLSQNPFYSDLVTKYNDLQASRIRLSAVTTVRNPLLKDADKQLTNLREELIENIASVKNEMKTKIEAKKVASAAVDKEMQSVPTKQRVYLEYSRQQDVLQEIYVYLLKKKDETKIARYSNTANVKIIDTARADRRPFFPQIQTVFITSILIGFLLPLLFYYVRYLLNVKISTRTDITNITNIPIIAELGHSDSKQNIVISVGSKSLIAEQFRALRTNLQFLLTTEKDKVIMLTSSMSEEGKSFITVNLAASLAISGKKVLAIELDLRRPKLSKSLGTDGSSGFCNYIIGQGDIESYIIPSGVDDNFFILPSGPIPPNPSELILTQKAKELFEILRKKFDYIIVDTPPIGFVTDAQLLNKYVDISLYVVRFMHTNKEQIFIPETLRREKKLSKVAIIVNDIKSARQNQFGLVYGYGYNSAYSFGYGNGDNGYYVSNEIKTSFLTKVKKIFRK